MYHQPCCLFEGSGKTYTMMGPVENPGVNRRALAELFKIVKVSSYN